MVIVRSSLQVSLGPGSGRSSAARADSEPIVVLQFEFCPQVGRQFREVELERIIDLFDPQQLALGDDDIPPPLRDD